MLQPKRGQCDSDAHGEMGPTCPRNWSDQHMERPVVCFRLIQLNINELVFSTGWPMADQPSSIYISTSFHSVHLSFSQSRAPEQNSSIHILCPSQKVTLSNFQLLFQTQHSKTQQPCTSTPPSSSPASFPWPLLSASAPSAPAPLDPSPSPPARAP